MSVKNDALTTLIRQRLGSDSRIAALAVDVACSEGFVSLIGLVDTAEQKRIVIELVSGLIGVHNIADEIRVRKSNSTADNTTQSAANAA